MPFRRSAVLLAVFALVAEPGQPAGAQEGQTPVCHYTGDTDSPYVLLMLSDAEVEAHFDHDLDLIPPPPTGCPTAQVVDPDDEPEPTPEPPEPATVTICHEGVGAVYETLTVDRDHLQIHADHPRDIIPAPAGGCPRRVVGGDEDDDPRRDGRGGGDRDGAAAPRPGSAPTLQAAPASVSATGRMPASLPVTGGRPDVLALLGLSLVLGGAGMRLRMLSRSS